MGSGTDETTSSCCRIQMAPRTRRDTKIDERKSLSKFVVVEGGGEWVVVVSGRLVGSRLPRDGCDAPPLLIVPSGGTDGGWCVAGGQSSCVEEWFGLK